MLQKPQGRVISIESGRNGNTNPPSPPQPAQGKRKTSRNPGPYKHSLILMHAKFVHKVARFYALDPQGVEETIVEAIQERRAA